MAKDPTTRDLSDKHAEHIARLFGAPVQRGSGNQSNRQTDNRMAVTRHTPIAFAFEGKATQRASLSVSLADWCKLVEQSHDLRPAMAYRFYRPDNLLVPEVDLIAVRADDFAEILDLANTYSEMGDR
jgi:hypothetical protein